MSNQYLVCSNGCWTGGKGLGIILIVGQSKSGDLNITFLPENILKVVILK